MSPSAVAVEVPHEHEIFIGSKWTTPATSDLAEVISPTTGEVICSLPAAAIEDADAAVAAARRAFDEGPWPQMDIGERIEILRRFTDALESRAADIDAAVALEVGMPITTAKAFGEAAKMVWDDVLGLASELQVSEIRDTVTGKVEVRHEPVGPTVGILTYNGANIVLGLGGIPGLVVGNPLIAKLPEESRMLGHHIAAAAAEAELPEGVLSIFAANAEVSKYLVAHPDVDAVHFTGGTEIGADVAVSCAKRIARVTLELGGKSAAIVADDADLDEVVPLLLGGMVTFQGQICTALSRILVSRHRHDELVEKLVDALQALQIGDPSDPETDFGPLGLRVLERSEGFIERAVGEGATVATGGKRPEIDEAGWFLEPTLLTDVDNSMEIAQTEVFGPVYTVIAVEDIEEAIRVANDSRYGLAGSVFSGDRELALDVARRIRSGSVSINGNFPCLTQPYGGMKQSGYGRVGGIEGLLDLTEAKVIVLPSDREG